MVEVAGAPGLTAAGVVAASENTDCVTVAVTMQLFAGMVPE
jgi:hypothetical protein